MLPPPSSQLLTYSHTLDFEEAPRSKVPPDSSRAGNPNGGSSSGSGGGGLFATKHNHLFSLSFYAQFFDVDTAEVLRRCAAALYPRRPFLDVLDGNPDLYGPFWIAATVCFILFLAGYMSQRLAAAGDGPQSPYDFRLLSGAAGIVYGYTFVVPLGLWGALRWFGGGSAGTGTSAFGAEPGGSAASMLECWALYGYANLIWIPVALLSWSPLPVLNWAAVAVGFAVSTLFLTRNLWPVLGAADQKVSRVLLVLVVVLHAALAVTIKFFFFA